MYLYSCGWRREDVDELPFTEALAIYKMLSQGIYGPLAEERRSYNIVSYLHSHLQAFIKVNSKNANTDTMVSFDKFASTTLQHLTGDLSPSKPENNLLKDALEFAEATGAITEKHEQLLTEMRNDERL